MKYKVPVVAILGLSLLAGAGIRPVSADEPSHEGHHWGHKDDDHGLGLTSEQKTKLHDLGEKMREAMKPTRRKLRDLRFKLADQVEDKASDSEIKSTLSEMEAARKDMREQMERFKHEKESILTPTQQAKMMLWREHRMKFMDHHEEFEHHEHEEGGMGWDKGMGMDHDGDGPHHHDEGDDANQQ